MAMGYGNATCTTSATAITSSAAVVVTIYNNDASVTLYVGTDNGVTTTNGFPIPPGTAFTFDFSSVAAAAKYWGVSTSSVDARWLGRV